MSTWSLLVGAEGLVWDTDGLANVGRASTNCDGLGWLGVSENHSLRAHEMATQEQCVTATTLWLQAASTKWLIWTNCYDDMSKVTAGKPIGAGRPGWNRYLKSIIGYTDMPPDGGRFFWKADPKLAYFLIQRTRKRGGKPAPAPGM